MESRKPKSIFIENHAFKDVYFIKIDAAGHSNIVLTNPQDKIDILFDLIEKNIYDVVEDNRRKFSCQYAEFWGWQGDGGLCVVFSHKKSDSINTCLRSAFSILDHRLEELQEHQRHQY